MRKRNKGDLGKVWGLALAVSFLAATSVQADILRTTDTSFLNSNQVLVELFTFAYDGTAVEDGVAAQWTIAYGEVFPEFEGFGYEHVTRTPRGGGIQSVLTAWFDSAPYDTFVGYWSETEGVLNVNGDEVGDGGNWFHYLPFDYGQFGDELTVNFGAVPVYRFVLYVVQTNEVPEPAAMAVIGLGVTGLALIRRRRKK